MKLNRHLSQTHLTLFETCPPQFQQKYVEGINNFPNIIQEEKSQWGNIFHLLMQQYNLGLPLDDFINNYPDKGKDLKKSLASLVKATEDIWTSSEILAKEEEYKLQLKFEDYFFTVIYDLLIIYPDRAIIFDWKTYLSPQNEIKLRDNWQTKLYLYVLKEVMDYNPSQLSFTYWFVKMAHQPESFTIHYNEQMHLQTKQELSHILVKITKTYEDYFKNNLDFPHHNNCSNFCQYYEYFSSIKIEKNQDKNITELPVNLDNISEINPFN